MSNIFTYLYDAIPQLSYGIGGGTRNFSRPVSPDTTVELNVPLVVNKPGFVNAAWIEGPDANAFEIDWNATSGGPPWENLQVISGNTLSLTVQWTPSTSLETVEVATLKIATDVDIFEIALIGHSS